MSTYCHRAKVNRHLGYIGPSVSRPKGIRLVASLASSCEGVSRPQTPIHTHNVDSPPNSRLASVGGVSLCGRRPAPGGSGDFALGGTTEGYNYDCRWSLVFPKPLPWKHGNFLPWKHCLPGHGGKPNIGASELMMGTKFGGATSVFWQGEAGGCWLASERAWGLCSPDAWSCVPLTCKEETACLDSKRNSWGSRWESVIISCIMIKLFYLP